MFRLFGDKKTFLSFAIIGFLLGSGGLGSTQQTAPSTANADQGNISDGELRAFVKAYVDNQKIRQKYEPTLENSTDPQKNREIQDRANADLKKSLAKQNRIYNRLNSDERLREKALSSSKKNEKRAARINPKMNYRQWMSFTDRQVGKPFFLKTEASMHSRKWASLIIAAGILGGLSLDIARQLGAEQGKDHKAGNDHLRGVSGDG